MKRIITVLSSVLVATSVVLAVTQQAAEKATRQPALKRHVGEVVSVNTEKSEIVIKTRAGKEMTLPISADAKIMKARKPVALGDIKAGDRVTCSCDESSGKCNVKRVTVRVAPTKKS